MRAPLHHATAQHHDHGWRPTGPRHRWLEPFVLMLVRRGIGHGYALVGRLNALGVAPAGVDVGELYRTLRELELAGLVCSDWTGPEVRAKRREYVLTEAGEARLIEWGAVMRERARLVGEFLAEYEAAESGAVDAAPPSRTEV